MSSIRLTTSHTILASACEERWGVALRPWWRQKPWLGNCLGTRTMLSPQPGQKRATIGASPVPLGTCTFCFPRALGGRVCLSQPPVLLPQEVLTQLHPHPGQPWGLGWAGGAAGAGGSALRSPTPPPTGAAVPSFILKIGILHSVYLGRKRSMFVANASFESSYPRWSKVPGAGHFGYLKIQVAEGQGPAEW